MDYGPDVEVQLTQKMWKKAVGLVVSALRNGIGQVQINIRKKEQEQEKKKQKDEKERRSFIDVKDDVMDQCQNKVSKSPDKEKGPSLNPG